MSISTTINNTVAIICEKIKRAFQSRHLFNNWISLLVRLFLIKLGFNVPLYVRVDDCIMKTESSVLERLISRFARGHIHINSLKCINGRLFINDIEVNDIREVVYVPEIQALINGWQYDETCSCWVRSNVRFKRMRGTILEIFDGKIYERLNVDNRVVVDVGAYIGDSTVYFALKGAKKVIAVEPHPVAYKELLENIKLNRLEDIVIPINAALSAKPVLYVSKA